MTVVEGPPVRRRNAAATRAAMLDAAVSRFARDGYDNVGVREIAADAGVDASLVCRYFGSKDELFSEVLACSPGAKDLFAGGKEGFGLRMARALVFEPQDNRKLDGILVMLRSASSPKAAEAIHASGEARFYGPLAAMMGAEASPARCRLAGALIMGVAINRALGTNLGLAEDEREVYCATLAKVLQSIVDG